ncbi:MAG: hypothetical protein HWE39_12835 [Oceanospirillaceae bacterium]|nr:hypothetical protein [Oceanospirillaceae bacterium]
MEIDTLTQKKISTRHKVNGREIVETGSVLVEQGGNIEINLEYGSEALQFIFEFVNTPEGKQEHRSSDFTVVDESTGKFTFTDFLDVIGTFNLTPMYLGTISNQSLYLSYRVVHLPEAGNLLFYTFSVEGDK